MRDVDKPEDTAVNSQNNNKLKYYLFFLKMSRNIPACLFKGR